MVLYIGPHLRIEDLNGDFTIENLEELENYVVGELLSDREDRNWLSIIKICQEGLTRCYGSWVAYLHFASDSQEIDGITAEIVLNASYLKTLDQLKRTLAHEYGHHWTLSYLAVNQNLDIRTERMPERYYTLRGLNHRHYTHDCSLTWERCDKEVVAEDYRFFFAPPHNTGYRMVECGHLREPTRRVRRYITNLPTKFPAVGFLDILNDWLDSFSQKSK